MAQTGFTPISNYYSATATNVPTAGNLVAGELAINTADGKLFYKDSSGVVQTIASKASTAFPNVNGSTSGAVTLAAPAVAGSNTATFPAATGTVMVSGNMPAFSAYNIAVQNVTTNTITKVDLDTEVFDTNSNFASGRFTPTVAGYYQINGSVQTLGASQPALYIYKNGSGYAQNSIGLSLVNGSLAISTLVYCNGSSDYIELYAVSYGGTEFNGGSTNTYMNGSLVRTA
jgi:hypothetical protein